MIIEKVYDHHNSAKSEADDRADDNEFANLGLEGSFFFLNGTKRITNFAILSLRADSSDPNDG